ncbi:hypothetical protein MBSD_n2153 [Mizugakiibacter sediminis]|uniref:Uncharacterized protein n=1 Tax=Mizugakiibacter sediminis TaxID=1475481 RepID=A0A0K8QPL4_9GAMM|nr:hypothetical protein [Mizugakiibacter sediminis]GAP66838.1 hypothetical protein MBSD_n2153 [Mizugakiibacter sediminis]
MKAALAIALFAFSAAAADFPVDRVTTLTSAPGEGKVAFLSRAAKTFRAFSDRTGYEACAEIATDGARFGLVVTTSHSHIGCAVNRALVPSGMTATGESIHSHGINTAFHPSRVDRMFLGIPLTARADAAIVGGQDPEHFSETDFAGAHGYLATPSGLKYQDGAGSERVVKAP